VACFRWVRGKGHPILIEKNELSEQTLLSRILGGALRKGGGGNERNRDSLAARSTTSNQRKEGEERTAIRSKAEGSGRKAEEKKRGGMAL